MSAGLLDRRLHLCDKVETEEDEGENMTLQQPFRNDKHLPSFPVQHPIVALLLLPSFIQPSSLLFPLFNGWVVMFPWDSWGGELSRARCFIMPNKGTCSDHLDLGAVMKPSDRNQALAPRQCILDCLFKMMYIFQSKNKFSQLTPNQLLINFACLNKHFY